MKTWFSKSSEETNLKRKSNAYRIALILIAVLVVFDIFSTINYISNTETVSLFYAMLLSYAATLATLSCVWLIYKSRITQAVWGLIIITLIALLLSPLLGSGLGLIYGVSAIIITTVIAGQGLEPRHIVPANITGFIFGFTTYLLDISLPVSETANQNAGVTSIVLITLMGILAVIVIREFQNFSLRTKLISVLVAVSLVSISVIAFASNQVFSSLAREALNQDLQAIADATSAEVNVTLEQNLDRLNILALNRFIQDSVDAANEVNLSNPAEIALLDDTWKNASNVNPLIRNVLNNEVSIELREFQSQYPKIVEVFVTDRYGAVIASTIKTSDYYQADEEWWQGAWNNGAGNVYISQPEYDENTKSFAIDIAIPIPGHNRSDLVGVLRSTVDVSELSSLLAKSDFGETGHSDLYFGNATYLSDDPAEGLLPISDEDFLAVSSLNNTVSEIEYEGGPSVVSRSQVNSDLPGVSETIQSLNWFVITHQDVSEAQAPIQATSRLVALISLGLLLIVAMFSYFLGNQFTRPLESLTAAANRLAEGDINSSVNINSKDELGVLANSFNSMASQLRDLIGSLEQRVLDRTRALATATEVSRSLSTILDEKQLANEVVEQINKAYKYYHGQIYLLDESGQTLVLAGATGEGGKALLDKKHSLSIEQGLVGRAARTKAAVLVPDTSQDPNWLPNPLLPDTKAEIAVPILSGERLLGVIDMQDNIVGDIYPEDIEYLTAIANQVAIGLQNARSYARTRQKAEREALISSINQMIQQEATVESAMKVAVREVGRALGTGATVKLKPGNGKPQGERDV